MAIEIAAWSGTRFHDRLGSWLYSAPAAEPAAAGPHDWLHRVDLAPPEAALRMHRR